ncbi:hypothetical protein C8R46DRAFT_1277366 [Mycena filopes]|nr:hypothetical protein C8R46DRAFT_1277366 [Mycena filopes]
MEPFLPQELERHIFETAASSGNTIIPRLLRVAKRIKIWVEPLLYRRLLLAPNWCLESEHFLRNGDLTIPIDALADAIKRLPARFLRTHVRHVFLDCRVYASTEERIDIFDIFAALAGVTDLMLNTSAAPIPRPLILAAISELPLLRLRACLGDLFAPRSYDALSSAAVDFSSPIFRHITHLALTDSLWETRSDWARGLPRLPALTHLSVYHYSPEPLFRELFQTCALLRVLVILRVSTLCDPWSFDALSEQEPRIVVAEDGHESLTEWYRGARGLGDYWERAEDVIGKRMLSGP